MGRLPRTGRLARISNETKQRIRQLKEQGYHDSVIACRLEISISSVKRILKGKNKQEDEDGKN